MVRDILENRDGSGNRWVQNSPTNTNSESETNPNAAQKQLENSQGNSDFEVDIVVEWNPNWEIFETTVTFTKQVDMLTGTTGIAEVKPDATYREQGNQADSLLGTNNGFAPLINSGNATNDLDSRVNAIQNADIMGMNNGFEFVSDRSFISNNDWPTPYNFGEVPPTDPFGYDYSSNKTDALVTAEQHPLQAL
jgi:hypothetical protein